MIELLRRRLQQYSITNTLQNSSGRGQERALRLMPHGWRMP